MPTPRASFWIMLLILAATVVVYANGLNGPFLFDDHIHITQNQWVKIDSLSWGDLARAWNSSFTAFPSNRPLAQLSFGVNHALAGLSPWAFKATNLAIHLLVGLLVFAFARLAYRAVSGSSVDNRHELILATVVAAAWLLHPMHVSTVLYTVQRMAQLSSLGLLAALSAYFWGRLQIAQGKPGRAWILTAAPIALLGFLGKENTVLLPVLLLVSELTLLRQVSIGDRRSFIRGIWVIFIALPLVAGLAYLLTHPGMLGYQGRPFTLEERLLTQPRVLWLYLRWLFVPDISAFGLFHDDIPISTGILSPPTTFLALGGLIALLIAALIYRRKAPFFSFAVLFFLANHLLESSIFPLEMIFEHRNYLASLGPLLFLAYLVTIASARLNVRSLAMVLGALLLASYTFVTFVRVDNWSSYENFIFSSAENHPDSPRSNFMAAQILIAAIYQSADDATALAEEARGFLHKGLSTDPRCINCLFGLLVVDLHQGIQPAPALISRLTNALRSGDVGPTKVSVSQFSYLVRWQRGDGVELKPNDLEAIFDAALANPRFNHTGRASIETAYREYYELVAQDLETALTHAEAAVRHWPDPWKYRMNLAQLLQKLGRSNDALAALEGAAAKADNETQKMETARVRAEFERNLTN